MAPSVASVSSSRGIIMWRPTTIMNMRDLSRDDDFLSHLLVEKIGTGVVPLLVHKMDPTRRLPKTDASALLEIVRQFVTSRTAAPTASRMAVDELLTLSSVRFYLKTYTQKQINAFATHASRYFELYHPSGSIEIAHTSRYSHRTGKSELCILATRPLAPGMVISELKGSMADLSEEEDRELKRTDRRNNDGIRRDFSVIHSKQLKKNHLFLGPARFVNHDCDNNCELFREGKYITFRVIRAIGVGEEVTAHYGYGYFGHKNRHCLCETCEKNGRGGYGPQPSEDELSDCGSDDDSGTSCLSSDEEADKEAAINVNERRTRRGVYAILPEKESAIDESEDEKETSEAPIALEIEAGSISEMNTPAFSRSPSKMPPVDPAGLSSSGAMITPDPDTPPVSASLSPLSPGDREDSASVSSPRKTPFKSVIATRAQKARQAIESSVTRSGVSQLATPPLSDDAASVAGSSSKAREKRARDDTSEPVAAPRRSKRFKSLVFDSEVESTPGPNEGSQAHSRQTPSKSEPKSGRSLKAAKGKAGEKEPSMTPSPWKGKGKEKMKVKEDPDARSASEIIKDARPTLEQDGLPRCSTCSNVLPLITQDSQVVWGLGFEFSPRKGKGHKPEKQDCPRCIRHMEIYNQPWPIRLLGQSSTFMPTPREESVPADHASIRKVTHKALPALDRKLAAAASKPRRREREPDVEERPIKRRKKDRGLKIEMSAKAKRTLFNNARSRSGRNRVPTLKVREGEPPKRKRGRPPKRTRTEQTPDELDNSKNPKSLAVDTQPRESNGRFGKKETTNGIYGRRKYTSFQRTKLSRAQRAMERSMLKARLEKKKGVNRRYRDSGSCAQSDVEEQQSNVLRGGDVDDDNESQEQSGFRPALMTGRPAFGMKRFGVLLCKTPNPSAFARRTWAPVDVDSESGGAANARETPGLSTDDDTDPPVTPETHTEPLNVEVADLSEPEEVVPGVGGSHDDFVDGFEDVKTTNELSVSSISAMPRRLASAAFKPSPVNFARRRWGTVSSPQDKGDHSFALETSVNSSASSDEDGASSLFVSPLAHSATPTDISSDSDRSVKQLVSIPLASSAFSFDAGPEVADRPWDRVSLPKNAPFLQQVASQVGSVIVKPTNLIHAGWETNSEASVDS